MQRFIYAVEAVHRKTSHRIIAREVSDLSTGKPAPVARSPQRLWGKCERHDIVSHKLPEHMIVVWCPDRWQIAEQSSAITSHFQQHIELVYYNSVPSYTVTLKNGVLEAIIIVPSMLIISIIYILNIYETSCFLTYALTPDTFSTGSNADDTIIGGKVITVLKLWVEINRLKINTEKENHLFHTR